MCDAVAGPRCLTCLVLVVGVLGPVLGLALAPLLPSVAPLGLGAPSCGAGLPGPAAVWAGEGVDVR